MAIIAFVPGQKFIVITYSQIVAACRPCQISDTDPRRRLNLPARDTFRIGCNQMLERFGGRCDKVNIRIADIEMIVATSPGRF